MSEENLNIEICGICLEELENNIYKTICGHLFHDDCIHKSMERNNCCPNCRKELQTPSASCIYEIINFDDDSICSLEQQIISLQNSTWYMYNNDTLFKRLFITPEEYHIKKKTKDDLTNKRLLI